MTFDEILHTIQEKHMCFPSEEFEELKEVDTQWQVRRGSNGWETTVYQYKDENKFIKTVVLRDTDGDYEEYAKAEEVVQKQKVINVYEPKGIVC